MPFIIQKPDGSLGTNPQAAAQAGGKTYDGSGYTNSGILGPTQSYALTFTKAGTYQYRCLIHDDQGMLATITVLPPGDASAASAPVALSGPATGTLAGSSGGAFAYYTVDSPGGSASTLTLSYGPFDGGQAHAIGLAVYQNGQKLGSATGHATGLGDPVNSSAASVAVTPSASGGRLLIQVFNYGPATIGYALNRT